MRKELLLCLLLFLCLFSETMWAQSQTPQKIFIESFTLDPLDQAAKNYPKTDLNGDLYSVVKVRPASAAFNFRFGMMKCIPDHQPHTGETWLYVQKNARRISIDREGFEPIMNVDLGLTVEAGATYILKLSYTEPRIAVQKQFLQFAVSPADSRATVKVCKENSEEYETWGQIDANGFCARNINCGTYEYRIVAEGYEEAVGKVKLDNPKGTHKESVTLVSTMGSVYIGDEYGISGAEVYIDDHLVGSIPYSGRLLPGQHTLSVVNGEQFKAYNQTFVVSLGEPVVIAPKLIPNTGEVHLSAKDGIEIYVDGHLKGEGEWSGLLKEGVYEVECRLDKHEPTIRSIEVRAGQPLSVQLDSPTPITGEINVMTEPLGAAIFLDGNKVGMSPMTIQNVLIGQHKLEFSLSGYDDGQRSVLVERGQAADVEMKLIANGKLIAEEPVEQQSVKVIPEPKKQRTSTKKFSIGNCHIYVQPTFQVCSPMSVGVAVGGYLRNFNIEADFQKGLKKSEVIYWASQKEATVHAEQYGSVFFGGRLGYGFSVGRFRMTPQVGAGSLQVRSTSKETAGYAFCANVGGRIECELINHLSLVVAPYYGFSLSQSDAYTLLSEVSSTFNKWCNGFDVQLGLSLFF